MIKDIEKLAYKEKIQLFEEGKRKRFLSNHRTSAKVTLSGSMKTTSHFYNGKADMRTSSKKLVSDYTGEAILSKT